jgi:hypothetical protein
MGPDLGGGGASISKKSGLLVFCHQEITPPPNNFLPGFQPPLSPLPLAKPLDASGLYAIFFQDNVNSNEILTLPILPNCPVNPYELLIIINLQKYQIF